jgi:hypothetical protein
VPREVKSELPWPAGVEVVFEMISALELADTTPGPAWPWTAEAWRGAEGPGHLFPLWPGPSLDLTLSRFGGSGDPMG